MEGVNYLIENEKQALTGALVGRFGGSMFVNGVIEIAQEKQVHLLKEVLRLILNTSEDFRTLEGRIKSILFELDKI